MPFGGVDFAVYVQLDPIQVGSLMRLRKNCWKDNIGFLVYLSSRIKRIAWLVRSVGGTVISGIGCCYGASDFSLERRSFSKIFWFCFQVCSDIWRRWQLGVGEREWLSFRLIQRDLHWSIRCYKTFWKSAAPSKAYLRCLVRSRTFFSFECSLFGLNLCGWSGLRFRKVV
jgi:hypothetical protein